MMRMREAVVEFFSLCNKGIRQVLLLIAIANSRRLTIAMIISSSISDIPWHLRCHGIPCLL